LRQRIANASAKNRKNELRGEENQSLVLQANHLFAKLRRYDDEDSGFVLRPIATEGVET
jgi:hypothetical protein